jgi:3D (Asp-Asp-Asp) domain-containing protein/peptidoglycan hydrolase CwlO-like protein
VRTHSRSDAALLATVFTGCLLAVSVPVALGAAATGGSAKTTLFRAETRSPESQERSATLQLYALESRLERARARVSAVAVRRSAVERERASIARRLGVAQTALRASEARLAELLRSEYQQGVTTDPLEIVLDASSLDEALDGLDDLDRAAGQSAGIVEQTRTARLRLRGVQRRLASRAAELERLAETAEADANELAAAVAEREAYLSELSRRRELSAVRIATAEARANTAARPPEAASPGTLRVPAAGPATVAPVAPVRIAAGATLTVTSTGYALRGRTSSGLPTGPGVVAVDPSVIPLGTRLSVPGYGDAVAADTGGAVTGNTIDLWFPTLEQAHAWGRRTVTVTFG